MGKSKEELVVELLQYAVPEFLKRAIDQLEARIQEKLALMDYEELVEKYMEELRLYQKKGEVE